MRACACDLAGLGTCAPASLLARSHVCFFVCAVARVLLNRLCACAFVFVRLCAGVLCTCVPARSCLCTCALLRACALARFRACQIHAPVRLSAGALARVWTCARVRLCPCALPRLCAPARLFASALARLRALMCLCACAFAPFALVSLHACVIALLRAGTWALALRFAVGDASRAFGWLVGAAFHKASCMLGVALETL